MRHPLIIETVHLTEHKMGQFGKTCFEFKAPFVRLENFYATIEYNAQVAAVLRSLEVLTDQIAGLQCLEADPGQVWLLE